MKVNKSIYCGLMLYLLLILSENLFSQQITITSDDMLNMIGSAQILREDTRFSIPVNVGSPGPAQTWDFRTTTLVNPFLVVFEYLAPQSTLSSATYPESNLVEKISDPERPGFEAYNYLKVTNSHFIDLGDSTKMISPMDTSFVYFQNDTLAPLPLAFNNTWMSTERDTTGLYPATANISIDTTINVVDAWGTVRLPMGDFQCLRLRQDVKVINQTIFNGSIISTGIDTYIQYNWLAKGISLVARIQSQNGETNPNFTNAQGFGRLDSMSTSPATGVEQADDMQVPAQFELFQNYPNPFNPQTTIRFRLKASLEVTLEVYNIQGQLVRSLIAGKLSAGSHSVVWGGRDEQTKLVPSGLYITRMQAGEFVQHSKMLLIK